MVISPPYSWQVRFNASDVEVRRGSIEPVEARKLWRSFRRNLPIFGGRTRKAV